ncbi:MAG: DEAD/DEAH box helicase [Aeromicrobium sp.]
MTEETSFDDLGLDDSLVAVVRALGYETPSPIQAQAIPALLKGGDVVGLAQTGTGKTAAFALPMVQRLDPGSPRTQALVLAPTRELALQVSEAIQSYSSGTGLKVLPVYGGQSYGAQLQGLKRGAQVVVGTPGRVIDHLDRGSLDLSHLEMLVLDEADEMLNMGFAEDVERILADTPEYKQVALFSATMPPGIRRLAKRYLHDPQDISTPEAKLSTTSVRQRWMPVSHHNKLDALTRVLEVEQGDAMLIFVRTKSATEELAEKLRSRGYTVAALNGDLAQAQRERTVGQLKSGAIDIVVATDVAARGLDVDRITHVVNYDIPHDPEAYVHRIGRTGRAGRSGEAIVFVTPRERRMLESLERVSGRPVEQMPVPTPDEVNARRADRFAGSITNAMGDPQFSVYRSLVEQYAQEHDVDMTDIASALAVMSQDDKQFFLRPDPPQEKRAPRERTERTPRPTSDGMASYRLAVGKRHKIRPAMVVGALANEGGLKRSDFGKITIGIEHTIVELPADLPDAVFDQLASTRISGKKIDIQPDTGRPGGERKSSKPYTKGAGKPYSKPAGEGKPYAQDSTPDGKDKKPRHKKG